MRKLQPAIFPFELKNRRTQYHFGMMYALFLCGNYSALVLTVTISDFVIVVHLPLI